MRASRLRQGIERIFRMGKLAVATDPASDAARDFFGEVVRNVKGFERTYSQRIDSRWRRTIRERRRFIDYRDDMAAAERNVIIDAAFKALAQDATAQDFEIQCKHERAKSEIEAMLKRTKYRKYRMQIMYLLNLLGDNFLICDINFAPSRKRNFAEISGFRNLEAWTMFRMSDERGVFPNLERSYMQIPAVELVGADTGFEQGSLLWNGERFYAGSPASSPFGFMYPSSEREFFRIEEIIHSRLNPWLKPARDGYGLSARRSGRKVTDVVEGSLDDAAIGRKLATFNRLHHKAGATVGQDEWAKYIKDTKANEPTPWTEYFTRGEVEIVAVDAQNRQLEKIEDLHLHVDLLELNLFYPMALLGFRAERVTGEMAERMDQRLNTTIDFQHDIEEYEVLRPACDRQLMYSGLTDVDYDVIWPKGPRREDENKFAKRVHTGVQLNIISRQRAGMILFQMTPEQADAEMEKIEKELKRIGAAAPMQGKPETSSKGKKGVEKKGAESQDISDVEGTGE